MTDQLTDTDYTSAQAALRGLGAPTIDARIISYAVTSEPDLIRQAHQHGWNDREVTDKLYAIICTDVLGMSFGEQMARQHTDRGALNDQLAASQGRWLADNPAAGVGR